RSGPEASAEGGCAAVDGDGNRVLRRPLRGRGCGGFAASHGRAATAVGLSCPGYPFHTMLQPREDQEAAELTRLLRAGHPLISIRTFEEHRAVELVRRCWLGSDRDLVLWSVSRGLHDGRFAEGTT